MRKEEEKQNRDTRRKEGENRRNTKSGYVEGLRKEKKEEEMKQVKRRETRGEKTKTLDMMMEA